MRIALFGLALVGVYLLGARDILAVLLAAVVSMALSFVFLRGMREDVVTRIQQRRTRNGEVGTDEAAEDSVSG